MPTLAVPTFVLLLHGGSWTVGTPARMIPIRDNLRAHGLGAEAPVYFTGQTIALEIPAEVAAVEAMVDALHAAGYRVILYGESSGAHISLCLAAQGKVEGCVAFSAPVDLPGATLWGEPIDWGNPQMAIDYSPTNRISAGKAPSPALLLHHDLDALVNLSHSQAYVNAAWPHQPDTTLIVMGGVGHGYTEQWLPAARQWILNRLVWPTTRPVDEHPLTPCG